MTWIFHREILRSSVESLILLLLASNPERPHPISALCWRFSVSWAYVLWHSRLPAQRTREDNNLFRQRYYTAVIRQRYGQGVRNWAGRPERMWTDWENCSFGSVTITGLNEVRSGYWDNGLQLEISQNEGPVWEAVSTQEFTNPKNPVRWGCPFDLSASGKYNQRPPSPITHSFGVKTMLTTFLFHILMVSFTVIPVN